MEAAADAVTGEYLSTGQGHQFALEWTGTAVVEMFRVLAEFVEEPASSPCDEEEALAVTAADGVTLGEYL
jgi:hypothetical protein